MNYNRFRYYDADCGRYVSLDPIGLAGGSNSYQYAPNPSGWTDPLGLMKNCACGAADLSPGELLRQKHGHLSAQERQKIR
nr:RHS repeat-associated core domain-containing protein [Massilia genomosp. 1]